MSPTDASGADRRPQDLQALHRRRVPALGVGALLRGQRRRGRFLANAALASRKDARDAVVAARKAFAGWSGRTAYNRGQILYRVAEMHGGPAPAVRRGRPARPRGSRRPGRPRVVDAAIDRLVWYAGWADKIAQVVGGANPVAGPYFNLSTPEPTGVVAVLAPQASSLLGLVSVVAPVIVTGNTVRGDRPPSAAAARPSPSPRCWPPPTCPAAWSTSSPAATPRPGPWLASHMDVNAHRPHRCGRGRRDWPPTLEVAAAENLKRVLRAPAAEPDWDADPGLDRMTAFLETKTVWHPMGV